MRICTFVLLITSQQVSSRDIWKNGGGGLLNLYWSGGIFSAKHAKVDDATMKPDPPLIRLLRAAYPEHTWENRVNFGNFRMKAQSLLYSAASDLFPGMDVHIEYIHPHNLYSSSGKAMEFDVFIPQVGMALEYQGKQHYQSSKLMGDTEPQQARDIEKREAAAKQGNFV